MNIIFVSSLLGVATFIVQVSTSEDGNITLQILPSPVAIGDKVVLHCQHQTGNYTKTTFFKDGNEIATSRETNMTIENVTQKDEGFYKCASQDRKQNSQERQLSVRLGQGNSTSTDETAASSSGNWKWIIVSCGVLLLSLIPLTVWLVCHYRSQRFCPCSWWPVFKQEVPAVALPATKQDVTEVQWDLSWMEMSSLIDKRVYPGT